MGKVIISDKTLKYQSGVHHSFKEKMEIARLLDKLKVDIIEMPGVGSEKADALLIKTVAPFISHAFLSVNAGDSIESAKAAYDAVKNAKKPMLSVTLPVSNLQMEFICHKKNAPMLEYIAGMVKTCSELCDNVEFCALDATRSEPEFLIKALNTAIENGANYITLCDSEGLMMPNDTAEFFDTVYKNVPALKNITPGFEASNAINMACANALQAIKGGAELIKTGIYENALLLKDMAKLIRLKGADIDLSCSLDFTQTDRITTQVSWILNGEKDKKTAFTDAVSKKQGEDTRLTVANDITDLEKEIATLGYDLTADDLAKVYEAFSAVASKKDVSVSELEIIVATTALQVPPTYKLKNFVITSGNVINATANLLMEKDGQIHQGLAAGDGPIDAAFRAIEQIAGYHYELDDFQIQAVTRGREALGSTLIKLRYNGKIYSGSGISTDVIDASIHAYVNALNKIVYEENGR